MGSGLIQKRQRYSVNADDRCEHGFKDQATPPAQTAKSPKVLFCCS